MAVVVLPVEMFQFTHPVWGATPPSVFDIAKIEVSIHAPRVGCDSLRYLLLLSLSRFQFTHPVWGATAQPATTTPPPAPFQFTHPVWGATA